MATHYIYKYNHKTYKGNMIITRPEIFLMMIDFVICLVETQYSPLKGTGSKIERRPCMVIFSSKELKITIQALLIFPLYFSL